MTRYEELLKRPEWDVKRKEILKRDNYQCRECEARDCVLEVHHHFYEINTMPWDYDDDVLITLCSECHEREEFLKNFDVFERRYLHRLGITRNKLSRLTCALSKRFDPLHNSEINREFNKILNQIRG